MKIIQKKKNGNIYLLILSLTFLFHPLLSADLSSGSNAYKVKNLVSDIAGLAKNTDSRLLNPWGLTFTPEGNILVADNGSDLATSYGPKGSILPFAFNAVSAPTGLERNDFKNAFLIDNSHSAQYLFATEAGTILAFNKKVDPNNAIVVVDQSSFDAIYKGLAIAEVRGQPFIYATDFHNATIDVFDRQFNLVNSFTDPTIPAGFAPFNIRNFDGRLYVTYALQKGPDNEDDQAGPGNGFVDIFSPKGKLIKRLISHGDLNSPWGLAIAPRNFGEFSGALIIGNFGDGHILAFSPTTGKYLGMIADSKGNAITIEGLWSLKFREDSRKGKATLYFTAGINDEDDGLFGTIRPVE